MISENQNIYPYYYSIINFFGLEEISLVISKYQRDYSWSVEKCEILLNDLINHISLNESNDLGNYFLGTIILSNQGNTTISKGSNEIIDGQQRIITIILLLAALAYNLEIDLPEQSKLFKDIFLRKGLPIIETRSKILKSILISGVYKSINVQFEDEERMIKVFEYFKNRTSITNCDKSKDHYLEFIKELRTVIFYSQIVVNLSSNSRNATQIFHNINFKGQLLSEVDLVKNHFFNKLFRLNNIHDHQIEKIDLLWNEVKANTIKRQQSMTFDKVFRYFWVANYSLDGLLSDSLINDFQDNVKFSTFNDASKFMEEVNEYIDNFNKTIFIQQSDLGYENQFRHPYEINRFISKTRSELGPIILPVLYQLFSKRLIKLSKYIKTLEFVERIIFLTVMYRNVDYENNLKKIFSDFVKSINMSNNIFDIINRNIDTFIRDIKNTFPESFDKFDVMTLNLKYDIDGSNVLMNFFMEKISFIYEGCVNYESNLSIEHIFNRSGSKDIYDLPGNLLFIENDINEQLSKKPKLNSYPDKKAYYQRSKMQNVKKFLDRQTRIKITCHGFGKQYLNFNETDIMTRTKELKRIFYDEMYK